MRMRNFGRQLLMLVLGLLLVLPATSGLAAEVDWDGGKIVAQGMGVAPSNAVNPAQARIMARRAAVVDGYRQLAEAVRGVNVDAETKVENMMVSSDVVKTKVSAMVKGARVIAEGPIPGGGYQVTMEVGMFGVSNSVAQAVLPKPPVVQAFPEPVPAVTPSAPPAPAVQVNVNVDAKASLPAPPPVPVPAPPAAPAAPVAPQQPAVTSNPTSVGGYTGLVVDCRGLGLKPVMSPVIKNADGQAIYGASNLDYDKVIAEGMASYTTNPSSISRAGSNPLMVKAVSLDNHNGNPVLSVADANLVLMENSKTSFLNNLKVVFLH